MSGEQSQGSPRQASPLAPRQRGFRVLRAPREAGASARAGTQTWRLCYGTVQLPEKKSIPLSNSFGYPTVILSPRRRSSIIPTLACLHLWGVRGVALVAGARENGGWRRAGSWGSGPRRSVQAAARTACVVACLAMDMATTPPPDSSASGGGHYDDDPASLPFDGGLPRNGLCGTLNVNSLRELSRQIRRSFLIGTVRRAMQRLCDAGLCPPVFVRCRHTPVELLVGSCELSILCLCERGSDMRTCSRTCRMDCVLTIPLLCRECRASFVPCWVKW